MGHVSLELSNGILGLTLSRADKRNALNGTLVAQLTEALRDSSSNSKVRVVSISGDGKDFSAGADLVELTESLSLDRSAQMADAERLGSLISTIRNHPTPVVALVHGRALGGGCGLAAACDAVLVHEDARLGFPEVSIGFVPALVMAPLRSKLAWGRAFDLLAFGRVVTATEAERIGLVTRFLSRDSFREEAALYLERLARLPPKALSATKGLLLRTDRSSFEEAIALGARANVDARGSDELHKGLERFSGQVRTNPESDQ